MLEPSEDVLFEVARVSLLRDNPSPPNILLQIDKKRIDRCQCR